MKKSIYHVTCSILLIIILGLFSGCGKKTQDNNTSVIPEDISEDSTIQETVEDSEPIQEDQETVEDSGPTKEELDALYEEARECYLTARFSDEIEIYRELYSYGYEDKGYEGYGLDKAMEIRENSYIRNSIVCRIIDLGVHNLKDTLIDPNSFVLYSVHLKANDDAKDKVDVVFDFGAANSFGGMVRKDYEYSVTLFENEMTKIYETLEERMKADGATAEDSVRYLVDNYGVTFDTQYEAIIEGTCNYGRFFNQ